MPSKDPCQREACQIQKCLQANNYKESKCEEVLNQMRRCCEKYGDKSGCCSGFLKDIKPTTSCS